MSGECLASWGSVSGSCIGQDIFAVRADFLEVVCRREDASSGTAPQSRTPIIMPGSNAIRVLGGGGVGEETLLQKGPSPTKFFPPHSALIAQHGAPTFLS